MEPKHRPLKKDQQTKILSQEEIMYRALLAEARELERYLKQNRDRLSPIEVRKRENLIKRKRQNAKQILENARRARSVAPGKKPLDKEDRNSPYWAPRRKPSVRFFG